MEILTSGFKHFDIEDFVEQSLKIPLMILNVAIIQSTSGFENLVLVSKASSGSNIFLYYKLIFC